MRFMRDYFEENAPEELKLFPESEEDEIFDEAGKEGVYVENYYFRDNLQLPLVSPKLSKRMNRDLIINNVGKFIDVHSSQLSTPGPVYTFTFGDKEVKFLYDLFGVDGEKLLNMYKEMINVTYNGKISSVYQGLVIHSPHKILLCAMIADAIQNGYSDILECCEYMFAFTEYPILYRRFWRLGVKEDVMNYTIEHLGNKYKIREFKSIQALLKYDSTKVVARYEEAYKKAADNTYMDTIYAMRTQIKSKLTNISKEYYKNSKIDATQHTNVTEFDDGQLADQEGATANMTSIINKVTSKFISSGVNKAMARISAEGNKTDYSTLEGMLNQIYTSKDNRINKFIEDVITAYFVKNPTAWEMSKEFMIFGLSLYRSIGTSKDPILVDIKSIMTYWMYDLINITSRYSSENTRISYARSIFNYMILTINNYS